MRILQYGTCQIERANSMAFKLHTANLPGNLHSAAVIINKWGWAEYLLHMEFGGSNTVCVFRMPAEKVWEIRENDPSYAIDPHHDDYTGPEDPYSIEAHSKVLASYIAAEVGGNTVKEPLHAPEGVTFVAAEEPPTIVPGATTKKRNGKVKAEKPAEPLAPAIEPQEGDIDASEQVHSPETAGSTDEIDPDSLPAWAR